MSKRITVTWLLLLVSGSLFLLAGFWIPAKAIVAQHLLHRAWQKTVAGGTMVKPWPWADTWPVGRLQNKRLAIDLIVLEGESGEVLAFGPGHLPESSPPGTGGHTILAGHRDTTFQFLQDLIAGDILILQGKNGTRSYEVVATEVQRAEDLYFDGESQGTLTLVTCYPFDALMAGGGLRYIVSAISLNHFLDASRQHLAVTRN